MFHTFLLLLLQILEPFCMKKEDLRIIFMGTPDFAVASLKALVEGEYNVVAVITMPDKPAGRGHKLQYSAVKTYAIEKQLPILQPEKLKDEGFLTELKSYSADLQIVVAFRMLPEVVWNMPPMGTFNLHASLLPQYRGAAPINWAVINGDKETGVTSFFLQHEIDTGNVIIQEKIAISPDDNAGTIHDKLMNMGAQHVIKTVDMICAGNVTSIPQTEMNVGELKLAPKIFKETCRMNFAQSAEQLHNFVRGLSPYPGAWCEISFNNEEVRQVVKIFRTEPIIESHNYTAGKVFIDKKNFIRISTIDGYLNVLELQLAGKKRMDVKSVLNGMRN